MAAVTVHSDSGAQENKIKSVPDCTFPPGICHEVMGPDAMISVFWMLNFKPAFSLFFHLHQEALQFLFTFCHWGDVICVSEVVDISAGNQVPPCCCLSHDLTATLHCYLLSWQPSFVHKLPDRASGNLRFPREQTGPSLWSVFAWVGLRPGFSYLWAYSLKACVNNFPLQVWGHALTCPHHRREESLVFFIFHFNYFWRAGEWKKESRKSKAILESSLWIH